MIVEQLSLVDFRNYAAADVVLGPGPNLFVGRNGQGKTNLVEAIGYFATLGSHRVSSDAPMVRDGADAAIIRARDTGEGCFMEIAQSDAAAYFDPLDAESIADGMRTVLHDPPAGGPERAARFTWDECARQHDGAYEELAGGG